jgi:predicted ABC-type ATPase
MPAPRRVVIAGPNGAGKTTFARRYVPAVAGIIRFVNVDLIAGGLSPLRVDLEAISAGRLFLAEVERLANRRIDFAFETTISGTAHALRLKRWKASGYEIEIIFLCLPSPQLALHRVATRVRQGGHNVPKQDVIRRFERGWKNFQEVYKPLANRWSVYDSSGKTLMLLDQSNAS